LFRENVTYGKKGTISHDRERDGERLTEKVMKVEEAARILNISTRQVIRMAGRVNRLGPEAAVHGNRKRKPANATENKVKDLVV